MARNFSSTARAKLADLARQHKPRKDRGLVAPAIVRDGTPGKACTKCLEWQPLTSFYKHSTCAGGLRNRCKACEKKAASAWQRTHPERAVGASRRWQAKNPEKYQEIKRAANRRRHGRKMQGPGISVVEYRAVKAKYGGLCAYCKIAKAETMDHVVPLSRGGEHSAKNIVPACKACNFGKHTKTPDEWRERGD